MDQLTTATFLTTINQPKPVLVDFWAPWCGPCKVMNPRLQELSDELGANAVISKVNVDNEADIAAQFKIKSLPTFILFKNGAVVAQAVGIQDKEALKALISKHI